MSVVITQGDDSNAFGKEITINVNSELDLTGFSAVFQLGDFKQRFDDIRAKKLAIVIPAEETKKLPTGLQLGALKIFDATGLQVTVKSDIRFYIYPQVIENEQA